MDPILSGFLIMAVFAVVFLTAVNTYIYKLHYRHVLKKDVTTQTIKKKYHTVSTHTFKKTTQEKDCQYPEKKAQSVDKGCDAQPVPHGAVVTEQVREIRAMQSNLQEYMQQIHSRLNAELERFLQKTF